MVGSKTNASIITTKTDPPISGQQNGETKPAETITGIAFTGMQGLALPLPSTAQTAGRQRGFLGPALPSGNPEGVIATAAEWAMRRQSALRNMGMQLDFMRQAFVMDEGATCEVRINDARCQPDNPGLMGFLSARYIEMHQIDPSLPGMIWRSHGYGQWSFEFQN